MRLLLTGGAGFIGQAVVSELAARADQVVVLDSLRPDVPQDSGRATRSRLEELGADLVFGDVRDPAEVTAALSNIDVAVHLAAKVGLGVAIDDMPDYMSSNEGPALDIGCGPGRFVQSIAANCTAALGIDISDSAVRQTAARGGSVLRRAVQHRLPGEGRWGTVLLADGNIGIGGDPSCCSRAATTCSWPEDSRWSRQTQTMRLTFASW